MSRETTQGSVPTSFISPIALGLISDPPTIVLTYDCLPQNSFAKRKRRKRKMPLRDFTDKSNVKRYAFNLRQRHNKYFSEVIDVTLEKMLRIIQEIQKGNSVDTSLKLVNQEYSVDPEEDLNIISPGQLAQRKAVMEEIFRKNLVKPGDPNYVYDRTIDFDSTRLPASSDWDDDEVSGAQEKLEAITIQQELTDELPVQSENDSELVAMKDKNDNQPSSAFTRDYQHQEWVDNKKECANIDKRDQRVRVTPENLDKPKSNYFGEVQKPVHEHETDTDDSSVGMENELIETGVVDADDDFWQ